MTAAVPFVYCADAGLVADWLVDVLGFEERSRWAADDGTVTNVELLAGASEVWLDGPVPDWKDKLGGLPCWVGFLVDDVDATHAEIVARGGECPPPVDREFGVRTFSVTDPEGHEWGFLRRISP